MRPIQYIELQFDGSETVTHFRVLAAKRVLVDLPGNPHVEQAILLSDEEGLLPLQLGSLGERVGLHVSRL